MPGRNVLTPCQQASLFGLPSDGAALLRHLTIPWRMTASNTSGYDGDRRTRPVSRCSSARFDIRGGCWGRANQSPKPCPVSSPPNPG